MHNGVTSHLWLKSALHASSHPCMCTCVLRLGCFLLACPVLYFVPPFSFQPFLMFTSEFNERSRSNPLCDFRLGTVVTSDHGTPLTTKSPKKDEDKSAVAVVKKCTTLELCITGHRAARTHNDFQEWPKSFGTNSTSTIHEGCTASSEHPRTLRSTAW